MAFSGAGTGIELIRLAPRACRSNPIARHLNSVQVGMPIPRPAVVWRCDCARSVANVCDVGYAHSTHAGRIRALCPGGEIGRRCGLKIRFLTECRFESGPGHQRKGRHVDKPSGLEKAAGLPAQLAFTALASLAAGSGYGVVLAPLLPVLAGSLASKRAEARVIKALDQINQELGAEVGRLRELTDSQYKLINGGLLALFENCDDAKVDYLRRAIRTGVDHVEISHTMAAQVSRALRDMTAAEMGFVLKYCGLRLRIGPLSSGEDPSEVIIDKTTDDMILVTGLIGLGALVPPSGAIDDMGVFVFAPFCDELKTLIER